MKSLLITSWTAVAAATLLLVLTLAVIRLRRAGGVVLGDAGDRAMQKCIRGHSNATEQIPIALILLGLAELAGAPQPLLAIVSVFFVSGRVAHALYFARHGTHWRFRFWGMWVTIISQGLLVLILAATLLL